MLTFTDFVGLYFDLFRTPLPDYKKKQDNFYIFHAWLQARQLMKVDATILFD